MHQKPHKRALKTLIFASSFLYLVITLPLLFLFAWNPTCRYTYLNIASHYKSKIGGIRSVHIGDSLTSGGGHWSTRLFNIPLNAYNLAGDGYTISQIRDQIPRALSYSPDVIFFMGGTNDINDKRYDPDFTAREFELMLLDIKSSKIHCIVTLIPFQGSETNSSKIQDLNTRILKISEKFNVSVINLNQTIAPDGVLLDHFTTDGTHFSEAAYEIWAKEISKLMSIQNN